MKEKDEDFEAARDDAAKEAFGVKRDHHYFEKIAMNTAHLLVFKGNSPAMVAEKVREVVIKAGGSIDDAIQAASDQAREAAIQEGLGKEEVAEAAGEAAIMAAQSFKKNTTVAAHWAKVAAKAAGGSTA